MHESDRVGERAESATGRAVADLVIVNHRLDPSALGHILEVTKRSAKRICILTGRKDEPTLALSRSFGAEVIDPADRGELTKLNGSISGNPDAVLVTLYGNGAHDPGRISDFVEQVRSGYDLVIGTSPVDRGHVNENVYLLNSRPGPGSSGFIACRCGCLGVIKANGRPPDIPRQALKLAGHLNVKYLDLADPRPILSHYSIGVVVPAYNEALLIKETIDGIPDYVERIYVVDDCSTDRTPDIVQGLNDPRITLIRHEKNRGVGGAIISGYRLALDDGMDLVAVMAGDNQMDPAQLPRLLLPVAEGKADYAKGNRLISRKYSAGMSGWRFFGNNLLTLLTKIASGYWHVSDPQNGYTVISRQALLALDLDSVYSYYGYCNDLLIKLNAFGLRAVDVAMPARYGSEKSKIKYSRFILKVAPMIFRGFLWRLKTKYVILDANPLVLFYLAGMLLAPVGLLSGAILLAAVALGATISPYYVLLAAFTLITGLQFLFFAMMLDAWKDKVDMASRWTGGSK